jgi:hypothetical protein
MTSSAVLTVLLLAAQLARADAITLVKATDGTAIVRINGALTKVRAGDRLEAPKALVREVTRGRLVLEETFTGTDGKPNRALIVIREGETGGTRYLQRPEKPKPSATKVTPARPPRKP